MESPPDMLRATVEAYAGRLSYAPGDLLTLHCSTEAPLFDVEIARCGQERSVVWQRQDVPGEHHPTPEDASSHGCRWPAAVELEVPASWSPGYYEVVCRAPGSSDPLELPACFVVRAPADAARPPILVVLSTNTYNAYNDWGGPSLYTGGVRVSFERPIAPGFLTRPAGVQLRAATAPGVYDPVVAEQRRVLDESRLSGWSAAAGWVNWEEKFARWCEGEGIALDYAVNADLELVPDLLSGRRLVISVGHDEYWSWGMRDALEGYVEGGGNVAFFSGNALCWQVRLEDEGRAMVSYKYDAPERDPVCGTPQAHLMTGLWSDREIGRPENQLTGVSFAYGGYARCGYGTPRGSGGYTIWRPRHWALAGTELRYGDLLGADDGIVGYEADGCEMTFDAGGLPAPTNRDGTPESFEILATAPARLWSNGPEGNEFPSYLPADEIGDLEYTASRVLPPGEDTGVHPIGHGHAVMGTYTAGGTVFTCGCTDWVFGLAGGDPAVEQITRNVIERLGGVQAAESGEAGK